MSSPHVFQLVGDSKDKGITWYGWMIDGHLGGFSRTFLTNDSLGNYFLRQVRNIFAEKIVVGKRVTPEKDTSLLNERLVHLKITQLKSGKSSEPSTSMTLGSKMFVFPIRFFFFKPTFPPTNVTVFVFDTSCR